MLGDRTQRFHLSLTLALCSVLTAASTGRADAPRELQFDGAASAAGISALGGGILITMYGTEAPQACRVCVIPGLDQSAAQLLGSREHPEVFARISDGLVLGGLALGGTASLIDQGDAELWGQDLAIIAESVLATVLTVSIVKRLSARVRPGIYFSNPNARIGDDDAYQSFFSGHSAGIAALAASVTTLAYLRDYDYRDAALATGIALTLSVGLLRMAADRHWLTDVVTGWVIGATIGTFIPLLLHERETSDAAAATEQPQRLPLIAVTF